MSIFYASHETEITVARSDLLAQLGEDQDEIHQIVYNYDLNDLFDSLFVGINSNTVDSSGNPVINLGEEIVESDLTAVHNALKVSWASDAAFAGDVKGGLEKLFSRFSDYTHDSSTNPTNDGKTSSNVEVSTSLVQTALSNYGSDLSLNMMSKSQIKSIAQSLIDLHRYTEVDGVQKLNLVENDKVVSYSNVSDSDNSGNTNKWEIVLNHTPAPAAPAAPAAPDGTNVIPNAYVGSINNGINNYTPYSTPNMPQGGGPYSGSYAFEGNPMNDSRPIFLNPATGVITLLNGGTVATISLDNIDTSLNANWNIVVTATGITFTYA